jgi:hypothetical protein
VLPIAQEVPLLTKKYARRSKLALVGALAAGLVAAGCGEDEKKEYSDTVNEANDKFERELRDA